MFKIKLDSAPAAFRNDFREVAHQYPNFAEGNILSNQTKFAGLCQGPRFRNRLLNQEQKNMTYINGFKNFTSLFIN